MTIDQEVFTGPLRAWRPLHEVLPLLRERMMINDGGVWVLENFSERKYVNIRLDMRTGLCRVDPGNERL